MEVMGNGGDFLESSGNQEDVEREIRSGKERKGNAYSSGFPENVRCGMCQSPCRWAPLLRGKLLVWDQRRGVEGKTPLYGCRKALKTVWYATVAHYSGRHQEVAEGKNYLSAMVSWPISSIPHGKNEGCVFLAGLFRKLPRRIQYHNKSSRLEKSTNTLWARSFFAPVIGLRAHCQFRACLEIARVYLI